jgi:hypothetical protein
LTLGAQEAVTTDSDLVLEDRGFSPSASTTTWVARDRESMQMAQV